MSILSWVTSIFGLVKIPGVDVPREECNPTMLSKWNDDHTGREDYSKHDGGWKDAKNDDGQPQKDYWDPKPSDECAKGADFDPRGRTMTTTCLDG